MIADQSLRPVGLSKSRIMAGRQCHKLLWWMVHEPAAPELQLDDLGSAVMDQGARVGELARTYVPGGVLIDLPYLAFEERLAATEQELRQGNPAIYEAAFRADGVFVSVDILERRGSGHALVEVKSTTGVKEHPGHGLATYPHRAQTAQPSLRADRAHARG
jgi:hypothetical protein